MNTVDKYDNYTVEDFAWDEQFRKWVLTPEPSSTKFWADWLQRYPERNSVIQQSKEMVNLFTVRMEKLSDQKKQEIISKTLKKINISDSNSIYIVKDYPEMPLRKSIFDGYKLGIAITILFVVAGLWLVVNTTRSSNKDYAYESLVNQSEIALGETKNTSTIPLLVLLSDGSKVILDKGARISYASSFINLNKREVYLSGDAFFEITKNPLKPFFVHVNGVITKVLGTSFKVKTDILKKEVTVEVVTGRVEVYEQNISALKPGSKKGNGVILTPNQKVVYSGDKSLFETALVDEPLPLVNADKKIAKEDFVFEDAPLSTVMKAIEKIYGIKVEAENDAILNCPFTGDISEQSLYRKLDAICQSTKTTYEIKETKIYIKGLGCY